jgi:hypothetical protein
MWRDKALSLATIKVRHYLPWPLRHWPSGSFVTLMSAAAAMACSSTRAAPAPYLPPGRCPILPMPAAGSAHGAVPIKSAQPREPRTSWAVNSLAHYQLAAVASATTALNAVVISFALIPGRRVTAPNRKPVRYSG